MTNEIVSSTGSAGLEKRSYNRWYYNRVDAPVTNPEEISEFFSEIGKKWLGRWRRRDVFRCLTNENVVRQLVANPNTQNLVEVAFPIRDGVWYLNAARVHRGRRPIRPVRDMEREVRASKVVYKNPVDTVQNVLDEGYTFVTRLENERQKEDLLGLWKETFGWKKGGINSLEERLKSNDPTVWFSAIQDKDGHLVAASMAESLSTDIGDGSKFDLVESTEWRSTRRDHMKAVLDHLHSQVINSYARSGGDYLIFGECNVNSRSYRAGQKSGMIIPHSNDYNIPQILVQNVVVKDGKKPRGLRDFVFMVLPKESLALPDAIQILSMTGGGR